MKTHLHQPDYGPTEYVLNLDVSPGVRDYADAGLHLLFFIPVEFILKSFARALSFAEKLEMKIVLRATHGALPPPR